MKNNKPNKVKKISTGANRDGMGKPLYRIAEWSKNGKGNQTRKQQTNRWRSEEG